MISATRRQFLKAGATVLGARLGGALPVTALAEEPGARPPGRPAGVEVLNPRSRVPVALIIDDSTCLANLAHFAIPQFAEVFPSEYRQDWKALPREIPDAFVRRFGEWCGEHGVKGKFSIVPYPACVGWLDRELPGWSRRELSDSLELVRTLMTPNFDIHPEMVSHTWVIDPTTGRPFPERSDRFMENWRWTDGKSVDQLAGYMAYALRILKNVGLTCQGITTPGGFAIRVLPELAQATLQAVRDVHSAEIPHYFRHLFTDDRSVAPRVEYASGLDGDAPRCVVSVIGCTGDWFGGWDGLTPGTVDQFITGDGRGGRLPEVIRRGEPAVLVGHWPGFYFNGKEVGFAILKEVVARLHAHFDHLVWLTLSELSRYWAARELTRVEVVEEGYAFRAPFACPGFTVSLPLRGAHGVEVVAGSSGVRTILTAAERRSRLAPGTFVCQETGVVACFDLPKGTARVQRGP
jgi:hypothetical protein